MQLLCCIWLTGSLILLTLAGLDLAQKSSSNKCDQIDCYQGTCLNGTCICKPGWTGLLCESCTGRVKLNGSNGFIIDGPFNYSKDARCTWLVDGRETSKSGVLTLTIDQFATECGWDHLYIFDGDGVYSKQLAALSGDMTQVTDASSRQYIAKTGRAYVFFYSDQAYNMPGFNISFKWEQCTRNCSGQGECLPNGTCSCHSNWTGQYCQRPSCSATCVNGKCQGEICICSPGYRGPFCNISSQNEAWYAFDSDGPGARASHAVAVVSDEMFVVGGYHFVGASDFDFMAKYSFSKKKWTVVNMKNSSSLPLPRYDHSLVYYKELGKLFMFGGVIQERNITNELWSFDLATSTWSLIIPDTPTRFSPLAVSGHTAHVIRCNQARNGSFDKMVVIDGYNPNLGYVNYVQEYFFANNSWLIASTTGATVIGTYGHSSVYDDLQTGVIYVYGGIGPQTSQLSDRLYSYDPCKRIWKVYQGSGYESYLHSAVIISKTMIIVGGNAHNESSPNKQSECYSGVILAYDIECSQWRVFDTPDYLPDRLARYGHRAVAYNENMYIYGGFNGRLQDDIVKFEPGDCASYHDKDSCVSSRKGGKCYWVKGRCYRYIEALTKIDDKNLDSSRMEKSCQFTGIGVQFECSKLHECTTCVTNGMRSCQWCSGQCRSDCTSLLGVPLGETTVTTEDGCPKVQVLCSSLYTCSACKIHEDRCMWSRAKNQYWYICVDKLELPASTLNSEKVSFAVMLATNVMKENVCPLPCALITDCGSCASSGCMWCSPLDRCVDMNAYQSSFPYGQCLQWSTSESQCSLETSPCNKYLTCASCHSAGPRCGWCDDGSNTGIGLCMEGGNDGPVVEIDNDRKIYVTSSAKCPATRWYFFDCPACQCNGHAKCYNPSNVSDQIQTLPCRTCQDDTTGDHCDRCRQGYYGNALNGGNCTTCECNNQATNCNSLIGKCYCNTKGVSGHTCDKCDHLYIGDPKNLTCFYELTVDFVFTFNLNSEDDIYITKINFVTRPPKKNTDVTFKLTCSQSDSYVGKVKLTVGELDSDDRWKYRRLLADTPCHEIERRFSAEEFQFGTSTNTTFLLMLYDFRAPIKITVSFAQIPTIG